MKAKLLYPGIILGIWLTFACTTIMPSMPGKVTAAPTQAAGHSLPQTILTDAPSAPSAEACIMNTADNPQCKDCCDCLPGLDAAAIKSCRDTCAEHDFSQNSATINFTAPSELGPEGDYSPFTAAGNQQECKRLCDSSTTLACGDRRFCRDACNKLNDL